MQQSNLFAHVELTKFIAGLTLDVNQCKPKLLSQHAYFSLIPPNMFSDPYLTEWEEICMTASRFGPSRDEDGRIVANEVRNTLSKLSQEDCLAIVHRVMQLHKKVSAEF